MLVSSRRRLLLAFLLAIFLLTAVAQAQNSFTPGRVWMDEAGKPIQSHSGGLLFENGVYYWYGMDYRGPRLAPNTLPGQSFAWFLNLGVTVYSSISCIGSPNRTNWTALLMAPAVCCRRPTCR